VAEACARNSAVQTCSDASHLPQISTCWPIMGPRMATRWAHNGPIMGPSMGPTWAERGPKLLLMLLLLLLLLGKICVLHLTVSTIIKLQRLRSNVCWGTSNISRCLHGEVSIMYWGTLRYLLGIQYTIEYTFRQSITMHPKSVQRNRRVTIDQCGGSMRPQQRCTNMQ
jgi:hypothetical protein